MVLSPGESFVEKSFISHPWMVRAWPRSSGLADVLGTGGLQQSAQTLYDNGIPADALMDEPKYVISWLKEGRVVGREAEREGGRGVGREGRREGRREREKGETVAASSSKSYSRPLTFLLHSLFDKPGIKESEGCVFVLGKGAEHKSNQFSIVFSPPMAKKGGRRKKKLTRSSGVSFMAKKRTPKGPHAAAAAAAVAAAAEGMGLGAGSARLGFPGSAGEAKRPATAGPVATTRNPPRDLKSLLQPNVVVVMMRQM